MCIVADLVSLSIHFAEQAYAGDTIQYIVVYTPDPCHSDRKPFRRNDVWSNATLD